MLRGPPAGSYWSLVLEKGILLIFIEKSMCITNMVFLKLEVFLVIGSPASAATAAPAVTNRETIFYGLFLLNYFKGCLIMHAKYSFTFFNHIFCRTKKFGIEWLFLEISEGSFNVILKTTIRCLRIYNQ